MASTEPDFEYDIFISYRHNDNRSGWVTEFVNALQEELAATIKEPVSVYFDTNPHDGLLESHNVEKSLEGKLKSLVFIPIISQTYCDTNSFAWKHEFCAFNNLAKGDKFGRDIKLSNGNVASRILPIKIHDLDVEDKATIENEIGGVLRCIEFVFSSPGINRPLTPADNSDKNQNKIAYRDQINKVANAVKQIVIAIRNPKATYQPHVSFQTDKINRLDRRPGKNKILIIAGIIFLLFGVSLSGYYFSSLEVRALPNKSIAVLPFENLSGDPNQEYFSDGIAEEILNSLTQLADLKVAGRTSSFQFKGKQMDLREIGEKLKVTNILEGSVRKQGDRVRITAQLISINDGYHLWSQEFNFKLDDVLAVQEEIAMAITQKLKITLLQNEKSELEKRHTKNTGAYEAYLKGRYFWNRRELIKSEKYFKQAIELDSVYAEAYAGLGETYVLFPYFHIAPPNEAMVKAEKFSKKAIQLDSMLSIPYAVIAYNAGSFKWDFQEAQVYFKRTLQLDPNYAPAHYWYGQILSRFGSNADLAISEMKKGVEIEPLVSVSYFNLGVALTDSKQYVEALEALKTSTELNSNFEYAHLFIGHCYLALGQMEKAKKAYERSAALSNQLAAAILIYFSVKEGEHELALKQYHNILLSSQSGYVSPLSISLAASYLGKKDQANEYLKKSIATHENWVINLNKVPAIYYTRDLLSDPRNVELVNSLPGRTY